MSFEFKLPDIGEGLTEGEVTKWLVKEGQRVREDEPMVEILTDKATAEITTPRAGVIEKILVAEGTKVPVGTVLVVIGEGGGGASAAPAKAAAAAPAAKAATPAAKAQPAPAHAVPAAQAAPAPRAAAPARAQAPAPVAEEAPPAAGDGQTGGNGAVDANRVVLAAPATRQRA